MLQWIVKVISETKNTVLTFTVGLAVIFCIGIAIPSSVNAQSIADPKSSVNEGVQVIQSPLGLSGADIRLVIANIIRAALGLLGIVAVCIILYGGYLWMTAGGNDEQIGSAKKILINGVIGLIIIFSAYSIVLFVMRLLGLGGVSVVNQNAGTSTPTEENFFGSGGLGTVIKDHFPTRNQTDVARNAKIIVTFRKPIDPSSIINNINGNAVLGDCVAPATGTIRWERDCDSLKPDSITVTRGDTGEIVTGIAVLLSYETAGQASTVVLRPYNFLGDSQTGIAYKVKISKNVAFLDANNSNPSVFKGYPVGRDFYEWQFTCGTSLDLSPPTVTSVYPSPEANEQKPASRNSVIQIEFNEPVDPIGVQGAFTAGTGHYALAGNRIFLKNNHSTMPAGEFRLLNGYRTLEFTPTSECGTNACGGKVYCMPVCNRPGETCKLDTYEVLLKSAETISSASFESVPLTGIADMAGNALDGNKNKQVEAAPLTGQIFSDRKQPDNFYWQFSLNSAVDLTPPIIRQVKPGLDAEFVSKNSEVEAVFSKRMRLETLYTISFEEQPVSSEPLCRVPRSFFQNGETHVRIEHCPFLATPAHSYYPVLDSRLEDVNFNCMFPGQGPGGQAEKDLKLPVSSRCEDNGNNCCAVSAAGVPFCCNGLTNSAEKADCIAYLKSR